MTIPIEERVAIAELISLHGHLTDAGELDRYDEVFSSDVVYDLSDFELGEMNGIPAMQDAARALGAANPVGHHVTNMILDEAAGGVVHARSKGIGIMADGTAGSVVYDDVIERQQGAWRIRRRRVARRRRPLGA